MQIIFFSTVHTVFVLDARLGITPATNHYFVHFLWADVIIVSVRQIRASLWIFTSNIIAVVVEFRAMTGKTALFGPI